MEELYSPELVQFCSTALLVKELARLETLQLKVSFSTVLASLAGRFEFVWPFCKMPFLNHSNLRLEVVWVKTTTMDGLEVSMTIRMERKNIVGPF